MIQVNSEIGRDWSPTLCQDSRSWDSVLAAKDQSSRIGAQERNGEAEDLSSGAFRSILKVKVKKVKADIPLHGNPISELRDVTCHMGSQCYLPPYTSERAPPNPNHAVWYSIYPPRRDGRLSWPSWLDSAPAGSRTSDLSITSPTLHHQDTTLTSELLEMSSVGLILTWSCILDWSRQKNHSTIFHSLFVSV